MRYIAEIVTKSITKDAKGNVLDDQTSFAKAGTIRINTIFPYSSKNASKEFGFEGNTTHRTSTVDEIKVNSYIRFDKKVYRIVEVAQYPRLRTLILELV